MTYERCFPDVSQDEPSQAPNSAAALTFAGWSESEARERIARLLASGWSAKQLALTFGVRVEEIDPLTDMDATP